MRALFGVRKCVNWNTTKAWVVKFVECFCSLQFHSVLSRCFLSEDRTITVFITTVMSVVLSGFQTSTFTVGKRDALRVSENSVKVKVKGKVHLRTGHEGPERVQIYCTLSLTSALDEVGGQRHAPAALPHCTEGWMGPRAGLDECGKSAPHRDSIPAPSSP
jgi:hypothetical protein